MLADFEKIMPDQDASFRIQYRTERQFPFEWHQHPEFELTYIEKSEGIRFVGDDIDAYHSGELVVVGPNLPHTWQSKSEKRKSKGSHTALVIQFREDFLGETVFEVPELKAIKRLLTRSHQGLLFENFNNPQGLTFLQKLKTAEGVQRITLLFELLDLLAKQRKFRTLASDGYAFSSIAKPEVNQRMNAVNQYIEKNLALGIGQPEAAKVAHLSNAAFSRFFKRTTGKTFTAYVNEIRIGRACQLLVETEEPVSQIAFEVGFENLSNFNRQFLKRKNLNPRDYRKQFHGD